MTANNVVLCPSCARPVSQAATVCTACGTAYVLVTTPGSRPALGDWLNLTSSLVSTAFWVALLACGALLLFALAVH